MAVWNQNYTFVAGQVPTAANWNANPSSLSTLLSGQVDRDNVDSTSADGIGVLNVNQTWTGNQTHTGTTQLSNTLKVGVNDTGYDVQFFGATSGAYMLWDESTDDLVLAGAAQLYLYDAGGGEHLSSDGTDMTINSGRNINLTCASGDVVIPANIGLTFGTGEKIEGDSTDLTVTSGGAINLTATTDVVVPANVGVTFGTGEKIEGDSTDLTVTSGGAINLSATTDVVVPANVGVTFGTGEKIEGDSTDLTVTSGGAINLTATTDVVVPANVGITFGTGEKIEGDSTDLTVTSGADINLTATGDVNIPADVGVTFGNDAEKIEGDGTDLTISGNNIKLTATADVLATGDVVLSNAAGPQLADEAATATNPTLIPNKAEVDTGIGWAAADTPTIITGGTERMRIDSAGRVTKPTNVSFSLTMASTAPSNVTGDGTAYTVVWNTEVYDTGSNCSSGVFTAPVAGRYLLSANCQVYGWAGSNPDDFSITIATSNRNYNGYTLGDVSASATNAGHCISVVADMDASDTAHVILYSGGGSKTLSMNYTAVANWFQGYLLG